MGTLTPVANDAVTRAEKLLALSPASGFVNLTYVFPVPPVTHVGWSPDDWIGWIDGVNGWRRP